MTTPKLNNSCLHLSRQSAASTLQYIQEQLDDQAAHDGELIRVLKAEIAQLKTDKQGLQTQVGKLLSLIDGWDAEHARETGGHTMHVRGLTPDWFVEAAFWACYGYAPNDARTITPVAESNSKGGDV
jgi:hypothetical protein